MSGISFMTRERDVDVRGTERAYAGCLIQDLGFAALSVDRFRAKETLSCLIPTGHYLHNVDDMNFFESFRVAWATSMAGNFIVDGYEISPFRLSLNTAIAQGSDPIIFLARVHATCELNGYVEGEHRAWLADIMQDGLDQKILRPNVSTKYRGGWEDVVELLRESSDGPCIMSYSGGDAGFGSAWGMGIVTQDDEGHDNEEELAAWEALSGDEQWDRSVEWLREKSATWQVDLSPETFRTRGFGENGHELSAYDVSEYLRNRPRELDPSRPRFT